jgi:DNA-binding transcriptional LysR family regulator
MLDFNLEYYKTFYYVAQLNSVSKAAEALFLSQPAITRSIKQLETYLGCKLFTRVSRGMQMTNEGRTLFGHVERAFDELIAAEKTLHHMANFESGILNIGATETALYYYLLPIIEKFRAEYPKVFINLSGSSTPETIQLVKRDEVDLAVAASPVKNVDDLVVTTATEFHDVFVASPQMMETEGLKSRTFTAKEICNLPIVAVEKGTSARNHINLWFKEQGAFFEPDYSVRTSSTVLLFVLRNLAIGILPDIFAKELLERQEIFELSIEKPIPTRQILIIHKNDSKITSLCRHFINYMNQQDIYKMHN